MLIWRSFSGFLSDRLGRKIPLIIAAFLFVLSAIGSGASNTFSLFIIFRLVGGLGIVLAVFHQWCGINVIFNYAEEIFVSAGYSVIDMLFNVVITGAVNLILTVVAMQIVDRWGRRNMMLLGAGGLSLLYSNVSIRLVSPSFSTFMLAFKTFVTIGISSFT